MSKRENGTDPQDAFAGPRPRVVYTAAMTLAGFAARYTPENNSEIPGQWARFAATVPEWFMAQRGPASFGLLYEESDGFLEYLCAVETVPQVLLPAGWREVSLPIARYAIFAHGGHVSELGDLENRIQREWLPASGLTQVAGFAGGVSLVERYGPRFDPALGAGDIEIWVPIEG